MRYTLRDISRDDAARAIGIKVNAFDVWLHRNGPFGIRRGGARLFSLQDIATIACARKLEGIGFPVREAVRVCSEVLTDPPDADAVLVIEDGTHRLAHGDVQLTDSAAESVTLLWVGHIADHLSARLEAPHVAV